MYEISTKYFPRKTITNSKDSYSVSKALYSLECSLISKTPFWKRAMDIIISSTMLISLAPVLLIIYFSIKVASPGPAFFKQRRVGYLGKVFYMYKFRTMNVNISDKAHQEQTCAEIKNNLTFRKVENDPRIFPLGKLLRESCLDELPQLFNVLKGEMSLVGPRPELPYAVQEFKCWHCSRLNVLPGITGLWQINGKNSTTFEQMVRYDINYTRNRSITLDIQILLLTIPAIISQKLKGTNS
jgi:lipopolysaccharide/colanic/teichoic acid biosynthesis glycosyltransferase